MSSATRLVRYETEKRAEQTFAQRFQTLFKHSFPQRTEEQEESGKQKQGAVKGAWKRPCGSDRGLVVLHPAPSVALKVPFGFSAPVLNVRHVNIQVKEFGPDVCHSCSE